MSEVFYCYNSPLGVYSITEQNQKITQVAFAGSKNSGESFCVEKSVASKSAAIQFSNDVHQTLVDKFIFGAQRCNPPSNKKEAPTPLLKEAAAQLSAYFSGKLKQFDLPLDPAGTAFQKKVWLELQKIPYGKTISYKQLAINAGNEKACRAVGMANNRNPISIIIPCHRVIGSGGDLVGYASGLENKRFLLDMERRY